MRVALFILMVPTVIGVVILVTLYDHLSSKTRGWMWLGLIFFLWAETALHTFAAWIKRDWPGGVCTIRPQMSRLIEQIARLA